MCCYLNIHFQGQRVKYLCLKYVCTICTTFSEHAKTAFCSQVTFSHVFGKFLTFNSVIYINYLNSLTLLSEVVIVLCKFLIINQPGALVSKIYFLNETLHVSGRGTARNMQNFIPKLNVRNKRIWLAYYKKFITMHGHMNVKFV
jgi:hypothetical protein